MVAAKWISVTRSNFAQVLPQVLEDIESSTFISLDTELTGLQLTRAHKNSQMDDLITRYGKLRESVSSFGVLQVGLACFKWNTARQKYKISAYSFYVFPSAANGLQQERKFTCQLGSLTFLSEFKFDFNKAFHEGIPFITRKEESIIKSNSAFYSENGQQKNQKPLILLKDEEKAIVSEVFDKIDAWLLETKEDANVNFLDLPQMNSFQRLIFYQQIPLKYGESLSITKRSNGILSVKRAALDPESRSAALQEEKVQFEKALEEQIGFRRVIDCIVDRQVPVIGHNCWVDFLHFYQKFIDNNLPPSLQGFKEEILKCFPKIIDTKYLAKLVNIKNSSLGDLTELASKYNEVSYFGKTDPSQESSTNLFHDAGFDAICTGRVFLVLLGHFLRPKDFSETPLNDSFQVLLENETLYNRLNVLQSDYEHLDLKGKEIEPDRSNVLYVYGISGSPSISDLQSLLQTLLKVENKISVQIHWLNDNTACFIQFEQSERASDVLTAFESYTQMSDGSKIGNLLAKIKIVTYRQYQDKRDQLLAEEEPAKKRTRTQ
jgi:poly(A)-specific ribonuclease